MDTTAPTPEAALLQLMELRDRCLFVLAQLLAEQDKPSLRALTRTCTRLHDLALPALSADISTKLTTPKQHKSLLRHLQAHGQLSRSLQLSGRPENWVMDNDQHGTCSLSNPHIKALPEPAHPVLESLGISCLRVAPDSLLTASMGRLQQLDISDCILTGTDDSLRVGLVAVGPSLRALRIRRLFEHRGFMQLYCVPFPNAALPSLTGLTSLELCNSVHPSAQLSVLSVLLALRELRIQSDSGIDMAAGDLPASGQLTSLIFQNRVGYPPRPDEGPHMAPAALSRVPALQRLVLSSFIAPDQGGTAGLLAELSKLTVLTMLTLDRGPLELPRDAGAAAAYASLTASSNLQALTFKEAHLPDGAWQHVFGPGKLLPHLQSLVLSTCMDTGGWSKPHGDEVVLEAGAMTADDVAGLAASCPGLTSLVLNGIYQAGTPLRPLLSRLTALQCLDVQHASDADASALPQLQHLVLDKSNLSDEGILQLTQLTQLTRLRFEVQGKEAEGGRTYGETLRFTNEAPAGATPDVASQLAAYMEGRKDPKAKRVWELKRQQKWAAQRSAAAAAPCPPWSFCWTGRRECEVDDDSSECEADSDGGGDPPGWLVALMGSTLAK